MMGKQSDQKKKPIFWVRWTAQRPGLVFGVCFTIHVSFVVITLGLMFGGYDVLPIVFNDMPLESQNEMQYRRSLALSQKDDELRGEVERGQKEDAQSDDLPDDEPNARRRREVDASRRRHNRQGGDVIPSLRVNLAEGRAGFLRAQRQMAETVKKWENGLLDERPLASDHEGDWLQTGNDDMLAAQVEFLNRASSCCHPTVRRVNSFGSEHCKCDPYDDVTGPERARRKRAVDPDDPHEREYVLQSLTLFYDAADGNVFTADNLRQIAEFEYSLYNLGEFKHRYCRLFDIGGLLECQQFHSILRFFDGSYLYAHDDLFDPSFKNVSKVLLTAHQQKRVNDTLEYFLAKDSQINVDGGLITSSKTRSVMFFGYPLKNYTHLREERGLQSQVLSEWSHRDLVPLLMAKVHNGVGHFRFLFYGQGLYWQEVWNNVMSDLLYLCGSFCFIFLFMWFQTGSLFVSSFGILSILTSFAGANLIYNVVIGYKFFGIFNILALFIILGIGADDIFIYSDTWKFHLRQDFESLELRLSSAFRRASLAMFVTSLTTMVAFFVNSFSPILPISAFGSFAGLTVLVNYLSVITYFPAAVTLYHRKFERYKCCCCCPTAYPDEKTNHVTDKEVQPISESEGKVSCCNDGNAAVSNFMGGPFFRVVTHKVGRVIILILFFLVVTCACYLASTITLASESFNMFDPSHHYEIARDMDVFAYKAHTDEPVVEVRLAWGLNPQDTSSCSHLEYDPIEPCYGYTDWDEKFDISYPETQMSLLNFCRRLRDLDAETTESLQTSSRDDGKMDISCFIVDMAEFFEKEGKSSWYPDGTSFAFPLTKDKVASLMRFYPKVYTEGSPDNLERYFEIAMNFWLSNRYSNETLPDKRDNFRKDLGQKQYNDINFAVPARPFGVQKEIFQTELVYAVFQIQTKIRIFTVSLEEALSLSTRWEGFLSGEISKLDPRLQGGWQTAGFWVWIAVLEGLAFQSISACCIGLGLAFVVIFFGTTNIITALMSTFFLCSVTICVVAIMPLANWSFGLLESLNLCLIVGLAADYIVHMAESYHMSALSGRLERVQEALEKVGVSILSGAITTVGSAFFMFFTEIFFFKEFGAFICGTVGFSMLFSLFVFPAAFSICGPEGYKGSYLNLCKGRRKYDEQGDDVIIGDSTDGSDVTGKSSLEGTDNKNFEEDNTDF